MDKSTIAIWQTKSSQFQSLYEESARREQKSKDDFITVNENLELTWKVKKMNVSKFRIDS